MQTIQPAEDYAFIKKKEQANKGKSKSGLLYIPETAQEQLNIATVINVGSNVKYELDDEILYKPYAVIDVKVNDEAYLMVNKEDIIGKIVDVAS